MITLVEALKLALNNGETKRAGVIATFARMSQWLASMPFKNIPGNAYGYNVEGALPGIAFRGLNETYTPSTGVINPQSEALRIAGGYLDVDRAIVKMAGPQVRTTQETMKAKAMAAKIAHSLVKGDSSANPREFDGLQRRLTGDQLMYAGQTDGGDALSLLVLDEFIDRVAGPNKKLWMCKTMARRLTAAVRAGLGGHIEWSKNEFGQQIAMYNNIPIEFQYPDNDGTESLAFDEVGYTGATATSTSIYCLSIGDGYVSGIQNDVMEVIDQGLKEGDPAYRTLVEWLMAMVVEHPRAAARLGGVKNVAVTA